MANPANNSFETWTSDGVGGTSNGACTNWTPVSYEGGTATKAADAPTGGGSYCCNIRSSAGAPVTSWGTILSDAFALSNDYITFYQKAQHANTFLAVYLYDSSSKFLASYTPAVVTSWTGQSIDVSSFKGQNVRVQFLQHTTQAGSGYYTYIDLVVASDSSLGTVYSPTAAPTYNDGDDVAPRNMTGYTVPFPKAASASSVYSGSDPWKVFDSVDAAWYCSGGSKACWVKIDLGYGRAQPIDSYGIKVTNTLLGRSPGDWTLKGSNDNTNWDTLDTVSGATGWSNYEKRTYTCDVTGTAYRYFMLDISDNDGGDNYTTFTELYLYYDAPLTSISASVSDTVNVSENISKILSSLRKDVYDTTHVSENLDYFWPIIPALTYDNIVVSDAYSTALSVQDVSDALSSISISDYVNGVLGSVIITVDDDIAITDDVSVYLPLQGRIWDTINISESIVGVLTKLLGSVFDNIVVVSGDGDEDVILSASVSDTVNISDDLAPYLELEARLVIDNIVVSENVAGGVSIKGIYWAWHGFTDESYSGLTGGTAITYTEEGRRETLQTPFVKKIGGEVEIRAKRCGNYDLSIYISLDKKAYVLLGTMNLSQALITFPTTFPVVFSRGEVKSQKFHIDPNEHWRDARIKIVHAATNGQDLITVLESSIIGYKEEFMSERTS